MEPTCSIWLVDANHLTSESLERHIRTNLPGATVRILNQRDDFLSALTETERPDIVLTKLKSKSLDGYAVLDLAREKLPGTVTVVLTNRPPFMQGMDLAISKGAKGYVWVEGTHTKGAAMGNLLKKVLSGGFVAETAELEREAEKLGRGERIISRVAKLSNEQLDLMRKIDEGDKSNKRACDLGMNEHHLNYLLKTIYQSIGFGKLPKLVALALDLELR